MYRLLTSVVVICTIVLTSFVSEGLAGVNVSVGINVPPPPAVVFPSEPQVVVVPSTRVYYAPAVTDFDMYRYGPYWYINRDGYWYRSRAYGGPFTPIAYRYVPHQVVVVPAKYRHHPHHPHGKHHEHGNQ